MLGTQRILLDDNNLDKFHLSQGSKSHRRQILPKYIEDAPHIQES
jgi:hypothetical protein